MHTQFAYILWFSLWCLVLAHGTVKTVFLPNCSSILCSLYLPPRACPSSPHVYISWNLWNSRSNSEASVYKTHAEECSWHISLSNDFKQNPVLQEMKTQPESCFKGAEIKIKYDCIWKMSLSLNFLRYKNVHTCFNSRSASASGSFFINLIVTAESLWHCTFHLFCCNI